MPSRPHRSAVHARPRGASLWTRAALVAGMVALGAVGGAAGAVAQTYGIATMQPGTLNHTSASALAKVLKEKARKGTITLIYGARDEKHNEALVLKQFLARDQSQCAKVRDDST